MSDTNQVQSTSNSYMSVEREDNVNEPQEEVSVNVESKENRNDVESVEPQKQEYVDPRSKGWWKKGQSGNPGGRPKGSKTFRKVMDEVIEEQPDLMRKTVIAAFKKAIDGDMSAFKILMEKRDGPLPQKMLIGDLTPEQMAEIILSQLEDE